MYIANRICVVAVVGDLFLYKRNITMHSALCILHLKRPGRNGGAHKTVNRHSSLICCACSCIFGPIMIVYNQLTKLEFS